MFKFSVPIEKSTDSAQEDRWEFIGKASSKTKDYEGDTLNPDNFDLSTFKWINYNHKAKDSSKYIVGEPIEVKVKKGELFIKGWLYNWNDEAKHIWNHMQGLNKSKSKNKFELSVEGFLTEGSAKDGKGKVKITQVAICPTGINKHTWADVVAKSFRDTEDVIKEFNEAKKSDEKFREYLEKNNFFEESSDEEKVKLFKRYKAMVAENNPTTKESLDGSPKDTYDDKLSKSLKEKSDDFQKIMEVTGIQDFETIEKLHKSIKLFTMEKTDIQKAIENLKALSELEVRKGSDGMTTEQMYEKAKSMCKSKDYESKEDFVAKAKQEGISGEVASQVYEKQYGEQGKDPNRGEMTQLKKSIEELQNSFQQNSKQNETYSDAISSITDVLTKVSKGIESITQKNEDIVKSNQKLQDELESIKKTPGVRKSIENAKVLERFEKSVQSKLEKSPNLYILNDPTQLERLKNDVVSKALADNNSTLMELSSDIEITNGECLKDDRQRSTLKGFGFETEFFSNEELNK